MKKNMPFTLLTLIIASPITAMEDLSNYVSTENKIEIFETIMQHNHPTTPEERHAYLQDTKTDNTIKYQAGRKEAVKAFITIQQYLTQKKINNPQETSKIKTTLARLQLLQKQTIQALDNTNTTINALLEKMATVTDNQKQFKTLYRQIKTATKNGYLQNLAYRAQVEALLRTNNIKLSNILNQP